MKYDLGIYGNCSQDYITNNEGVTKRVLGGSLIYISLAAKNITNKKIISIGKMSVQTKQYLSGYGINILSQDTTDITFIINECKNTCIGKNYDYSSFKVDDKIYMRFLHISFRKGIDIEGFLCNPNIKYNALSIDVAKFSAKKMEKYIRKYHAKIKILFCDMEEYELIKDSTKDIPLIIVTNKDKYVKIITPKNLFLCEVIRKECVTSSTGAGDSFIGGFLGEYIVSQDLTKSLKSAIKCAYYSLDNFGPLTKVYDDKKFDLLHLFKLPQNIIVLGNSCAGKTTFINHFMNSVGFYTILDDLRVLQEVFFIEDLLINKKYEEFINYEEKIKYIHEIYYEHKQKLFSPDYYTTISETGGHNIIRTELWNYILELLMKSANQYNIIEFARGTESKYIKTKRNLYDEGLEIIVSDISDSDKSLIIYIVADKEKRKQRNWVRYQNSGHYVSDTTMDNIYAKECFFYDEESNSKKVFDIQIPVLKIINNDDKSNQTWNDIIKEMLIFYENIKK